MKRKMFTLLLLLSLGASSAALAAEPADSAAVSVAEATSGAETLSGTELPELSGKLKAGDAMPDFTVATRDGGSFTLSEALKDHDMVLVNYWASWCGPCKSEFPYMQAAWEEMKDDVAVIALSVEPSDTDEVLNKFASELGLTLPMGRDTTGTGNIFANNGIPSSVIVDRFGNIAWTHEGAIRSKSEFERVFSSFTGDGYTETKILEGIPEAEITAEPADSAALSEALNVEGGSLVFDNVPGAWPMLPDEKDGRTALRSTNSGEPNTEAAVAFRVEAADGDLLTVDYRLEAYPLIDALLVQVDGKQVKRTARWKDWSTCAVPMEAGEHEVKLVFSYAAIQTEDDGLWLDNVALLSGKEAEDAAAALPAYPVGGKNDFVSAGPEAREIVFNDPDGMLASLLGVDRFYLVNGDTAKLEVTLGGDADPDEAFVYSTSMEELPGALSEQEYDDKAFYVTIELSDDPYTLAYVGASTEEEEDPPLKCLFRDEKQLEAFIASLDGTGIDSWSYADEMPDSGVESVAEAESVAETAGAESAAEKAASEVTYRVTVADGDGNGVPGAVVLFCTDENCVPVEADDKGVCEYKASAYEYHLQVLTVPEGYSAEGVEDAYTDLTGTPVTMTVKKG